MSLKMSKDLSLPIDVAGETIAILAKRGAGKTNTATVLVEELVGQGVQTVIIDPVGAWWGLRSSQKGERGAGLAIPILGGTHGDVPLEQTAGQLIADVAVDTGQSMLIDLSDFPSKAATHRFVKDFADRLYRRKAKNQSLMHVVLEEADEFAPQSPRGGFKGDTGHMAAAIEQIVRRGRARGLGVTLITQRSAVLNKDVLTQADVLVVMRTTGPQDVKAIKDWVDARGDEKGAQVIQSLPGLTTGEAWFWNPERDLLRVTRVRKRRTFDSSATPKAGMEREAPGKTVEIDLSKLGEQIQSTAERAKENDPAQLRKHIRDLERELTGMALTPENPTPPPEPITIEVPILTDEDRAMIRKVNDAFADLGKALETVATEVSEKINALMPTVEPLAALLEKIAVQPDEYRGPDRTPVVKYAQKRPIAIPGLQRSRIPDMSSARHVKTVANEFPDNGRPTPAQRKVLNALAWFEAIGVPHPSRAALAPLAGTRPTSGGFKNNLGALRTAGLIDYPTGGKVSLTDEGRACSTPPAETPTNQDVWDAVRAVIPPAQWRILEYLIGIFPADTSRETLADGIGVPATSGGFKNNLGALRTLELLDYPSPGWVQASPLLFPHQ